VLGVGVQQHLLAGDRTLHIGRAERILGRRPAEDRILRALGGALVVPVGGLAVGGAVAAVGRDAEVVLLGAGLDVFEDLVLVTLQSRDPCLGVGVLLFKVGDHRRVVLVPLPLVLILEVVAVMGTSEGPALGNRSLDQCRLVGLGCGHPIRLSECTTGY